MPWWRGRRVTRTETSEASARDAGTRENPTLHLRTHPHRFGEIDSTTTTTCPTVRTTRLDAVEDPPGVLEFEFPVAKKKRPHCVTQREHTDTDQRGMPRLQHERDCSLSALPNEIKPAWSKCVPAADGSHLTLRGHRRSLTNLYLKDPPLVSQFPSSPSGSGIAH